MKPKVDIIVLSGVARSGKDTWAREVVDYCRTELCTPAEHFSTINPYKEIAANLFDWKGEKDESGRRLLSDLKTAAARYNRGPLIYTWYFVDDNPKAVKIIQTREPEEMETIKRMHNTRVMRVLVDRPRLEVPNNVGDQTCRDGEYDEVVMNTGTVDDLRRKARQFANKYLQPRSADRSW
jgi:hypothetical protein